MKNIENDLEIKDDIYVEYIGRNKCKIEVEIIAVKKETHQVFID